MKKIAYAMMSVFLGCGFIANASAQTSTPVTQPTLSQSHQLARAWANATVVIKMMTYSAGLETPSDRETYLLGGTRSVTYYLENAINAYAASGAASQAKTFDPVGAIFNIEAIFGYFEGLFAAAQDMALVVQKKVAESSTNPEDLPVSVAMGQLPSRSYYKSPGVIDTEALKTAIRVYARSGLTPEDFVIQAMATGNNHYATLHPTPVAKASNSADNPANSATVPEPYQASNNLSSTGTPAAVSSTLGTLTAPVGGAIAFGDGGFPVIANSLDSHTLSTGGGLAGFSMSSGMDTGSLATPSVCTAAQCTESSVVRWGTWGVGGSVDLSSQMASTTANSQLHYLIGTATTLAQYGTLTGTASYAPVGGTSPTDASGRTYTATIGNINVNFTGGTATLASYALTGNGIAASEYTYSNVPLTISTSGSGVAKVIAGTATNTSNGANNTTFSANGFVAGATGSHLGMGFKTSNQAGTLNINQVQAFKR